MTFAHEVTVLWLTRARGYMVTLAKDRSVVLPASWLMRMNVVMLRPASYLDQSSEILAVWTPTDCWVAVTTFTLVSRAFLQCILSLKGYSSG